MRERVKILTFVSGHGEALVRPVSEDHINECLGTADGRVRVTQSESERPGQGHHLTVCVWYEPDGSPR
ncbi:MAG: hypothetical protein J2P46_08285 [Zavarzinella sp.]|nr:hypothetical protein [Zavarzinella sp.]